MSGKHKDEGALATMAYVRGWRQNNDGRWFKRGVAGTFNSASDAFKGEDLDGDCKDGEPASKGKS